MKKVLLFLVIFVACLFGVYQIKADEEVVEEPVVEETEEMTEEDFKKAIEDYLAQYIERDTIQKLIGWLTDAGVLASLFFVYLKYRKYKHTTIEDIVNETKKEVGKYLTENFDKLSKEQVDKINEQLEKATESLNVMMKVLALSQDSSTKGKLALIEYLGENAQNKEVKETVKEVSDSLNEQKEIKEEVFEKVEKEYTQIF